MTNRDFNSTTFYLQQTREVRKLRESLGNDHPKVLAAQDALRNWIEGEGTFSEPKDACFVTFDGIDIRKLKPENASVEAI